MLLTALTSVELVKLQSPGPHSTSQGVWVPESAFSYAFQSSLTREPMSTSGLHAMGFKIHW